MRIGGMNKPIITILYLTIAKLQETPPTMEKDIATEIIVID